LYQGRCPAKFQALRVVAERKLQMLDSAVVLGNLRIPPANRLEKRAGKRQGQWSIRVNEQWRICFRWTDAGRRAVSRVFPRTTVSAAVRSACIAACSEHDRLIGVTERYHLSRLPAEFEHAIDSHLSDPNRGAGLSALLRGGTDSPIGELERLVGEAVMK
jgi:proteic killer suppression protein